ncbi:MAG TPA: hypothetical protein VFI29_23720 [Hanamia sp.]|nr:hypothetical protein [Hanamia sp.]
MLEELFNLVKSVAGDSVINNADVPNEKNNEVVAEATNTVASGLRNIVAGGGLQNLVSLLKGSNNNQANSSNNGLMSNPIVNMMVGHLAGKLMSKYNLGSTQANSVSSSLIPNIIGSLVHKTNDPNNSTFSLENLLNSITGGKAAEVASQHAAPGGGGLSDLLGSIAGGSDGGGLMDIVSKLAGGALEQQQKNEGGGLMDLIKGFIK